MTSEATSARLRFADGSWRARLEAAGLDWLRPDRDDRASLVKENALRRIYRMSVQGESFFIKQHVSRGLVRKVKDSLLGSSARIEFGASAYAAAHGVPAVRIVACGQQAGASTSLSPAIDDARPLPDVFAETASGASAKELIHALADLLATAHRAGFLHADSHPGNILVRSRPAGGYECLYVDVYGARYGRAVTDDDAARDLAALNQWFADRVSRSCRLRFLKEYVALRHGKVPRSAFKALAGLVLRRIECHAHKLYRKRDRRIGRDNAYFSSVRLADRCRAVVTLRHRPLEPLFPPASPGAGRGELIEEIRNRSACCIEGDDRAIVRSAGDMECFFAAGWWSGLVWRLTGSPAWSRYRTANLAGNRDLPAVRGRAYLVKRTAPGAGWEA